MDVNGLILIGAIAVGAVADRLVALAQIRRAREAAHHDRLALDDAHRALAERSAQLQAAQVALAARRAS